MTDLLAIFGPDDTDSELLTEIERLHPTRVTVLLEDGDSAWAVQDTPRSAALRDRLAALLTLVERRTGATVTGLAGDRGQIDSRRFDRAVSVGTPVAV